MMRTQFTVLMVGDHQSNLLALRKFLHQIDCEIVYTDTSHEVLTLCITHDVALILLDTDMPSINAYDVASLLKGEITSKHIPIILLTSSNFDQMQRRRGYQVGAVDFIQMPADDLILFSKIPVFFELHKNRKHFRNESIKNAMFLRANESLLSNALRISNLGSWEWNILGNFESWSAEQCRIFGLDPVLRQHSHDVFINAIHPEDRTKVLRAIDYALAEVNQLEVDCRICWPNGNIRHIHCQAEVYRNDVDEPFLMIGTTLDITEQHKREEAQRLAMTVFNTVDEGVIMTDPENRIIAVNPAFCHITGYTQHDALGQTPSILSAGTTPDRTYQEMWASLNYTGLWTGEISNRSKDGDIYIASLSIKLVRDEQGKTTHHVGVFSDITEKKKTEQLIWQQANFDELTQLANRRMLHDRLLLEINKVNRESLQLALLLIDLDRFKEVNDTLGHDMGDQLLVQAAQRISTCVRNSDTVSRLGGDEFVILLSPLDDLDCVDRIAGDIIAAMVTPFKIAAETVYISGSIGIALYPNDASDIDNLLKHADQAMYVSKNAGRNRTSYFAPAMQEAAQMRRHLTNDLRCALEHDQFLVYYQPIVDMVSGQIYKAEALIRWQHPVRGLVSPAQFIPLAEESGMIVEIGDWVFRESARQVKRLRQQHHPQFQLSVNKSPVQFRTDNAPFLTWFSYLDELGLSGQSIVIEITEGLLMNVEKNVTEKLLAFRDAGIQVSLDDFGTGYSSLSYLKKFDIDYIKIDQSFVRNMDTDADNLTLCESIILMAHKLGLKVIAEGVETTAQRDLLAGAGCDFAQGYLYSRPIPAMEFEALLAHARGAD
jgi:diguanylate cyclase (GGDEF)-like protein